MSRFDNRNKINIEKNEGKKVFFQKTEKDKKLIYTRKTYHLSEEIVKALALMSAFEGREKSEIVRESLKEYIPKKYFNFDSK